MLQLAVNAFDSLQNTVIDHVFCGFALYKEERNGSVMVLISK